MTRDLGQEARNKALVLEAFDALFNRRDFEAAERHFSSEYVQHSAGIAPGRDGLFALVRAVHRRYESALAVAEGGRRDRRRQRTARPVGETNVIDRNR